MFSSIKHYFQQRKKLKLQNKLAQIEFEKRYITCLYCAGKGYTLQYLWIEGGPNRISCNYCLGSGWILREEYRKSCSNCFGKGYIDPQDKIKLR